MRHFRNLGVQHLEVPPEGAAIVGENGHGKTNLLEAIYYLETFRSFRGSRDDELVAFGEEAFHVAADLEEPNGGPASNVAAGHRRGGTKKVVRDGAEARRLGDAVGGMAAVTFSPADVAIVSAGPSERRRFLDILLSLNVDGYLEALQRFRSALRQRNAALKGVSSEVVRAWDPALVEEGATVMAMRRAWIETHAEAFARYHAEVAGGHEATIAYEPSVDPGDAATAEEIALRYVESLEASRDVERRLRTTVRGPHRDEMSITLHGDGGPVDLRKYGSGGQRRTAALALRLVEGATVRRSRGRRPLVLLDDVFAELDEERSERVLGLMEGEETGQVLVTAPKESDVRLRRDALPRWRIREGLIAS